MESEIKNLKNNQWNRLKLDVSLTQPAQLVTKTFLFIHMWKANSQLGISYAPALLY